MTQFIFHNKKGITIKIVIVLCCVIAYGVGYGLFASAQFQGPTCVAGSCNGKVATDASGNIAIGTSTASSSVKLLITTPNTATTGYGFSVIQPAGTTIFSVRNDGLVSISGTLSASSFSGSVPAASVTPGVFNGATGGNYAFNGALGVGTTTQVSLPQNLSVYGSAYLSGSLGIGTTNPTSSLSVTGNIQIGGSGNGLKFPDGTIQTTAAASGVPSGYGVLAETTTAQSGYTYSGKWLSQDSWSYGTTLPITSGYGIGGGEYNGKLYFLVYDSSVGQKKMYEYDPTSATWTQKASPPAGMTPNSSIGYATVGAQIFFIGGYISSSPASNTVSNKVYAYNASTNTWSQKTNLPVSLNSTAAATDGTNVYVFGGSNSAGTSLTGAYRYNVASNTWTTLTALPSGITKASTAYISGIFYIAGGYPTGSGIVSTVTTYTVGTGTYSTAASMPYARGNHGASVINGKMYIFGGLCQTGTSGCVLYERKTFEYTTSTNSWAIKTMQPDYAGVPSLAVLNAKVYMLGDASGVATPLLPQKLAIYDPAAYTYYIHTKN
jgi:hypothetical protein